MGLSNVNAMMVTSCPFLVCLAMTLMNVEKILSFVCMEGVETLLDLTFVNVKMATFILLMVDFALTKMNAKMIMFVELMEDVSTMMVDTNVSVILVMFMRGRLVWTLMNA